MSALKTVCVLKLLGGLKKLDVEDWNYILKPSSIIKFKVHTILHRKVADSLKLKFSSLDKMTSIYWQALAISLLATSESAALINEELMALI